MSEVKTGTEKQLKTAPTTEGIKQRKEARR